MKQSDQLLLRNRVWAAECKAADPEFFQRLAREQRPAFLWIGCSDSRVPSNQITGTSPGDVFAHRNIANVFLPADVNLGSVLQYAVEVLQVQHVIVCGHHGCGGINAAMQSPSPLTGPISDWLDSIRALYAEHRAEIDLLPEAQRADRLCELNVRAQVERLSRTALIKRAWDQRQGPWLHGWVYSLSDGILHELVAVEPSAAARA